MATTNPQPEPTAESTEPLREILRGYAEWVMLIDTGAEMPDTVVSVRDAERRIQDLLASAKAEGRQEVLRELREYASTHNSVQTTSYAWKLLLKGGATDEA